MIRTTGVLGVERWESSMYVARKDLCINPPPPAPPTHTHSLRLVVLMVAEKRLLQDTYF